MKKLLTLFTLLLTVCSGAWAQYEYDASTSVPYFTVNFNDWAAAEDASSTSETTVHNPRLSYNSSKSKWENHSVSTDIAFDADGFYYIYNPGTARQLPTGDELSALTYVVAKAIGSSNYPKYGNSSSTVSKKDGESFTTINGLSVNSSNTADAVYEFHMPKQGYVRLLFGTDSSTEPSGGYNATLSGATTGSVAVNYLASDATYSVKTKSGVSFTTTTYTSAGKKMKSVEFAVNAGTTTIKMNPALMAGNSSTNRKLMMYAVEVYVDDTPSTPTLTGAWKIGDAVVTSANVVQGGSVTIPTFTVGATSSGTPTGSDYNVAYELKEGSTSGIFEFTDGVPTGISAATAGTATVTATLTTKDASKYLTPATNTFEYTVTVNAPAAPTFSPDASAVVSGTEITMTSPDGGEIWYTTSGDDPTESNKTVYDAEAKPTITGATTIKAIARVNGYSSAVTTADYTIIAMLTQNSVSTSRTWDWSELSGVGELTGATNPTNAEDFVMANMDGVRYSDFNLGFNSNFTQEMAQEIVISNTQYVKRSGNGDSFQNGTIKINFAVPGKLTVYFTGTNKNQKQGGSEDPRYLVVNSSKGSVGTNGTTQVNETFDVVVGDNTISFETGKPLRIQKLVFVEAVPVTISAAGYATFSSTEKLDFTGIDGLTAYKATATSESSVTLKDVTGVVPAGTGLLLKGAANTYYIPVSTAAASDVTGNLLQSTATDEYTVTGSESGTAYVFGSLNEVVGFYKAANGKKIGVGKSWLLVPGTGGAKDVEFLSFVFGDEEQGETDGIKAVSTKVENGVRYNLAGQKVGADYKGIVIVNGKKVIIK